MKSDSNGDVLEGSPYSEARIIQAIRGLNRLWNQQATMDAAIDFLRSCEVRDEKFTMDLLAVSEYRRGGWNLNGDYVPHVQLATESRAAK